MTIHYVGGRTRGLLALVFVGLALTLGSCSRSTRRSKALQAAHRLRDEVARSSVLHENISISRDGRRAAYVHGYGRKGLFVLDLAGEGKAEELPVSEAWPRNPMLSPDARFLSYVSMRLEEQGKIVDALYLFDLQGHARRELVHGGAN